jgi:hypothetical protein
MRCRRPACLLLAAAFAACGGGGTKGPSDSGAQGGSGGGGAAEAGTDAGSCDAASTITVSGALTGTRSALAAGASWSTADNTGAVFTSTESATPFQSAWSFTFTGQPSLTTYTQTTPGLSCVVTAGDPAAPTGGWEANRGVMGTPDQGTCSLTLTSVTPTLMLTSQTQYCVHGSVQATLPAKTSGPSTGTVMLTASF